MAGRDTFPVICGSGEYYRATNGSTRSPRARPVWPGCGRGRYRRRRLRRLHRLLLRWGWAWYRAKAGNTRPITMAPAMVARPPLSALIAGEVSDPGGLPPGC